MTQTALPERELTTGDTYRALDALVRKIEDWPGLDGVRAANCERAEVRARVVQRILEITIEDFTRHILTAALSASDAAVELGGLRISPRTGSVRVSPRLALLSILGFGVTWWRFTLHLLRAFRSRPPGASRASAAVLLNASGFEQSDDRFARFCTAGPITPLTEADRIVVQATQPPAGRSERRIDYTPQALPAVAAALAWPDRLRLLATHLTAPLRLAYTLLVSPLSILVSRDLALVAAVRWLDRKGILDALIVTTSDFSAQPLWMHGIKEQRFALHMIWYSQNFMPKMYVGEQDRSDLPAARHMRVDEHWVWTDGFAAYLRELDQHGRIHVVGPLVWYLEEPRRALEDDGSLKVAVFDVTPFAPGKAAFGAAKNYYALDTIRQFVADIVRVCDEVGAATGATVTVLLKHKRAPSSTQHDSSYIDYLERLQVERPGFRLIDHRTDLFALLAECDVSVSIPYTSTAYVGAHLAKPALYYDPFAEIVPLHEPNDHVVFCSGPAQLRETLSRILIGRATRLARVRQGT